MRFRDIPQFKNGDYQIDVAIEDIPDRLEQYKRDWGLELNPDFQRGHIWTREQQIAYMEFLLKGGKNARIIYFNCPNFKDNKEYDFPMQVIDGVQRLNAITSFLNDDFKVFDKYFYSDFEDRLNYWYDCMIFNINDLKTRLEILEWYKGMNSGGTPHSKEEMNKIDKMIEEELKKKYI